MRKVLRWVVPVDDKPHRFVLTVGSRILAAAAQSDSIIVEFWAEDDNTRPPDVRYFQVFGTGHPIPDLAAHRATCARTPLGLVWHLYEVQAPR